MQAGINLFVDQLPTSVQIENKVYEIESDFRCILSILRFLEDEVFTEKERIEGSLSFFYKSIPNDLNLAYAEMLNFIRGYKEVANSSNQQKAFDFDIDSNMIYTAFVQSYGIDLAEVNMHWFKFISLFENMSDGTPRIVSVMDIRTKVIDPKWSDDTKRQMQRLKNEYSLEKNNSETKRNTLADTFASMFGKKDK